MYDNLSVSVIIAAAGLSRRMGGLDKLYLKLKDKPVLAHTVEVFNASPLVDEIVIVCHADGITKCMEEIVKKYNFYKIKIVVSGGDERYNSIKLAIREVKEEGIILVHDGARPFVTEKIIHDVVAAAARDGAAIPVIPVKDTIKVVELGDLEGKYTVKKTLDRISLRAVQTPEAFQADILHKAYRKLDKNPDIFNSITDDASLVEMMGHKVTIVDGDERNIKITTPQDMKVAEKFILDINESMESKNFENNKNIKNIENNRAFKNIESIESKNLNIEKNYLFNPLTSQEKLIKQRIGIGYDVHSLVKGRALILGGVDIPFEKGLLGHSDADVLLHAIMDAILGAAALGDIGRHFPDTDEKYHSISSLKLLGYTRDLLDQEGYFVGNIDATIVAQKPKISPYVEKMIENISAVLKIPKERVSIKCTTTEKLGFEGRGEGISASSVALIFNK